MPILRLAYATQFLIALIAIFVLWSQVGGQGHLDLVPWHLKLLLGAGAAFCVVKATAGAVAGERAWNGKTLRWFGILLVLLIGCGFASYYVHLYDESDEDDQQNNSAMSSSGSSASCATLGAKCANTLWWRCSALHFRPLPGGRKGTLWWPGSPKPS